MNIEEESNTSMKNKEQNPQQLKLYCSPRLENLGDVRSLTLGVSNGNGESGNESLHYDPNMIGMPPFG